VDAALAGQFILLPTKAAFFVSKMDFARSRNGLTQRRFVGNVKPVGKTAA
jgi:hypothetical protein